MIFEKPQIRLVIADDDPIYRSYGLRRFLEEETDLKVVGEASDGAEAVRLARQLKPDILLLDLRMPKHPGLEALRERSTPAHSTPVELLKFFRDSSGVRRMEVSENTSAPSRFALHCQHLQSGSGS